MSEPSHGKKVALFQHMSGWQVSVCMPVCVTLCVWLLCWHCSAIFLTVMMPGLHKLTDGEGENGNKNGRQGKSKMRATETEREKKSHSEAIVDNSSRFFSLTGRLFLSSVSIHLRLSFQGHWLMSFNIAGQPGSVQLRKWDSLTLTSTGYHPPSK